MTAIVFEQSRAQRHRGGALQTSVDGRVHPIARRVDAVAILGLHLVAYHFRHIRCIHFDGGTMQPRFHRAPIGLVVFGLADVAEFPHAPQHVGAADLRGFGAGHRVHHRGRRRNAGQGGHFSDIQLIEGLAEVDLGGGGHAVRALPEEYLVHIQGEDLLLGELGFHQKRDVDLAHFPLHVPFRG